MYVSYDDFNVRTVIEIDRDVIERTFKACVEQNEDLLEDLESEWNGGALINGSVNEANHWLTLLAKGEPISGTEDTLCWAIAECEQDSINALEREILLHN